MTRLIWLVLPLFGCVLPFVHSHREKAQPPEAVQRFSHKAQALAQTPGAPGLSEVTYSMSGAIQALPEVKDGDQLATEVSKQAGAMKERPNETDTLARMSLDKALEAVRRTKPAVSQGDKDKAVGRARHAVEKIEPGQPATLNTAYAEIARAMMVVTGGSAQAVNGSELTQLVARFAVEEPDDARRTGAQVIAAMGDELQRLPHPPADAKHIARELRKRAERLATASRLDYSDQLKEALSMAVGAFDRAAVAPAQQQRLDNAQAAVAAIRDDRPLALQQGAAQAALERVTDAILSGR
jgi:hypothetical protein